MSDAEDYRLKSTIVVNVKQLPKDWNNDDSFYKGEPILGSLDTQPNDGQYTKQ